MSSYQNEVDSTPPELGTRALLRWMWRQLTSMRTALILLLLLGLAAIPGSLIPQRSQNPMKVQEYLAAHGQLARVMLRLHLFDVYGSPWFSAVYLLLFTSLIGCVLPRTITHLRHLGAQPPLTPRYLNKMEFFTDGLEVTSDSLDRAERWLKAHRFRIRRDTSSISAEKGYLRETGNLLFHLSLILILIAVAIGGLFSVKGEAIVNVGERFINVPTSYDNIAFGRFQSEGSLIPFSLTVDKFSATYDVLTNAPTDYTLNVTTSNPVGSTPVKHLIKVNKPLTFGNTKIYLQANGYSPLVTIRDKSGWIIFSGPVPFLPQDGNLTSVGAIKIPDMEPQVGMVASFLPTAARDAKRGGFSSYPEVLDPRLLLSIWTGDLGLNGGVPQSVYRLDTSKLKRIGLKALTLNESYDFGVGSITFDGWKPWVNLQIVSDPGKMYALIGAILAILGLLVSLFVRQRRIWVKVGDRLEIAGLAKNGIPGLADEVKELGEVLR